MKPRVLVLAILTLLLSLSACYTNNITPPVIVSAATGTPTFIDMGFNFLIVVEGDVQLKRDGWKDYNSTAFGAVLYRGDLLRPESSAKVVVLCDNLTIWNVPPGVPSGLTNGCPQPPDSVLMINNSLLGSTRGSNDPLIPYIISPRATKLLTNTPILRWNPSPGATGYSVQIKGEGVNWQDAVTATHMIYPGKPLLEPGTTYLLIVEADNGKSSQDEGIPGLGFSLLSENDASNVRDDAERLNELTLPTGAKSYALAQLYAGHGLMADAVDTLDSLVKANSQTAAVYRLLGDFYQGVGLPLLAEPSYQRAIGLAENTGDIEGLALAQGGLGTVYETLGNKTQAIYWLKKAKTGFDNLGDKKRVSEIQKQLDDLTP